MDNETTAVILETVDRRRAGTDRRMPSSESITTYLMFTGMGALIGGFVVFALMNLK